MGAIGTVVGMLGFLGSIGVGSNRLHVAQTGSCCKGWSGSDSVALAQVVLVISRRSDVSGGWGAWGSRIFNISDLGSGTGMGLPDRMSCNF